MTADLVDFMTADLVDFVTADLVDFVTADLVDCVTADLVDFVTADWVEFMAPDAVDSVSIPWPQMLSIWWIWWPQVIDFVAADLVDSVTADLVDFVTAGFAGFANATPASAQFRNPHGAARAASWSIVWVIEFPPAGQGVGHSRDRGVNAPAGAPGLGSPRSCRNPAAKVLKIRVGIFFFLTRNQLNPKHPPKKCPNVFLIFKNAFFEIW